jgi:CRP-like cAMP-binding protein/predicted GNAT family N-acyltransferase
MLVAQGPGKIVRDLAVPAVLADLELLRSICRQVRFEPGDVLRQKGQHYRDMYVITDGCVDVDPEPSQGRASLVVAGIGAPIGEIAFLRGSPATATVTARTATAALVIGDPTLARLEREQPALTARWLRHLARTAEERTNYNLTWAAATRTRAKPQAIEVHLCRSKEMLERAKRLRYEVYCEELGRQSPYADHDKKVVTDHLDDTGHVFIAVEAGETIGTLRGNASADTELGAMEELYGMRRSPHHPEATSICTKFIVRKSKRGGAAGRKLIAAMVRYGIRNRIKECYIDCIPALLPYYKALGFKIAGQKFFHPENGPSHPMALDLVKHGRALSHEGGTGQYLSLIVRAQAIRLIDRLRGYATSRLD